MNKYLLGVLMGLGTISTTYASIVSRGFLDEALTSYATTTALDLKADKADLTALSDIIGTLPTTVIGIENYINDYVLPNNIGEQLNIIFNGSPDQDEDREHIVYGLMELYEIILGLRRKDDEIYNYLLKGHERRLVSGGWREWRGLTEMDADIKNNTAKIGTLPAGYETVGDALTAINAKVDNKIENLSETASAGKYVLTAVKVGDQTTYAWELIDRSESETTTTSEQLFVAVSVKNAESK